MMQAPVMTDVEKVALWAGLIASVGSIVLSVVAIVIAIVFNQRSERVSDQTISSLQKIESEVEHLSQDTSGLIKAAWEKMLGSFSSAGIPLPPAEKAAASEVASGITAELRSQLKQSQGSGKPDVPLTSQQLESALKRLQETLEAQFQAQPHGESAEAVFSRYKLLQRLSPEARELALQIRNSHVNAETYEALMKGALAGALKELRNHGIIIPLSHGKGYVYWFPPGESHATFRPALAMTDSTSSDVREKVAAELRKAGYQDLFERRRSEAKPAE